MNELDRRLLELIRSRAGDAFRGALRYDADGFTTLYVRDDVKRDELRDALPTVAQRVRDHEPIVPEGVYPGLGRTQATVELHEDVALVHFSPEATGGRGLVVSLDRDVAQGLGSFVEKCLAVYRAE